MRFYVKVGQNRVRAFSKQDAEKLMAKPGYENATLISVPASR